MWVYHYHWCFSNYFGDTEISKGLLAYPICSTVVLRWDWQSKVWLIIRTDNWLSGSSVLIIKASIEYQEFAGWVQVHTSMWRNSYFDPERGRAIGFYAYSTRIWSRLFSIKAWRMTCRRADEVKQMCCLGLRMGWEWNGRVSWGWAVVVREGIEFRTFPLNIRTKMDGTIYNSAVGPKFRETELEAVNPGFLLTDDTRGFPR